MKVYATCGRGTEIFAVHEVKRKLKAYLISREDGKIFFESPVHGSHADNHQFLKGLLKLKTVERVFVTCAHFATSEIKGFGKLTFLRRLKEKILDPCSITEAISDFEKVHSCSSKHYQTASQRKALITGDCQEEEYAVSPQQSYKCEKPCSDSNPVLAFTQTTVTKKCEPVERSGDKVPGVCNSEDTIDFSEQEMPQRKKCKQADVKVEAAAEATMMSVKQTQSGSDIVTFRFSVKCAGWCKRWLQPQRLSKECGKRLCHLLGWKVDLHSPMYDIHIHINDDYVTAGLPLTSVPLSKRHYISEYGLRSTLAWIMADVADIQAGDHVLDPMCGKGIILIEAARDAKYAMGYIGCDVDVMQLEAAARNLASAQVSTCVQLMQTNAEALPLRDSTMDKIICDAPFGHKFTVNSDLQHFYSSTMAEIERVLVPGGRLVLLTSQDMGWRIAEIFQTLTDADKPKDDTSILEPSAECDQENDDVKLLAASDQTGFKTSRSDWRNLENGQSPTLLSNKNSLQTSFKPTVSLVPHARQDQGTEQLQTILKRCLLLANHYIKLGETHGSLIILQKRNNKN